MIFNNIKFQALLVGLIFISICCINAQSNNSLQKQIKTITISKESFRQTGTLPSQIEEASGLALSNNNSLWTHNDDGAPVIFCIEMFGKLIRTLHLNNKNSGWEDLARDKEGNLFIGAFGNNTNDKKDLKVLIIKNPETITEKIHTAEVINFTYEDQKEFPPSPQNKNFDSDALIAYNDSLYIFTKNRTKPFTGYSKVYRLPKSPGTFKAVLVDSIFIGKGPMMDDWVTGADISPEGTKLALLGHSNIWIISEFGNHQFSNGNLVKINLSNYSHKAGIAFTSECEIYIVDEKELGVLGGSIYQLNICEIMRKQD